MELVALSYSPWSEKARWALDHHRIPYEYAEYVPMLGELPLRVRAGKMSGKITVPILFDGDAVFDDSLAIARHAERLGMPRRLFPDGKDEAIVAWNAASERVLNAGRALVIERMKNDREAQRESVPKFVPSALRGASVSMAATAMRFLAKKHDTTSADLAEAERTIDRELAALRDALGGKETLLGAFSYADIAMAVVLQMVAPVDGAYIRLSPAVHRCWSLPALARKNADLVEWRDAVYAKHRRVS